MKLLLNIILMSLPAMAQPIPTSIPLDLGFAKIPVITENNLKKYQVEESKKSPTVLKLCKDLEKLFKKYRWDKNPCGNIDWKVDLNSNEGHGLIYTVFGSGKDTTLFLGGVHPDEMTPVPITFRLARYLHDHPEIFKKHNIRVVIAPLINPDGIIGKKKILRTNNLVDVNRNFLTLDWYEKALDSWRRRRSGLPRYFPGYFPNTEIETKFQVDLIDSYKPQKILSVHAPLGFLDYDGPADQKIKHLSHTERQAKQFVHSVSKKSRNYRVVDYSFYPGSLGNYAGNERDLPTITLELETSKPSMVNVYWAQFLPGFLESIHYPFQKTN